jgi:hypothetical protein
MFLVTASLKLDSKFKIPDYREAVHFAIDRKPKIAMVLQTRSHFNVMESTNPR